jgi:hypothetical protein
MRYTRHIISISISISGGGGDEDAGRHSHKFAGSSGVRFLGLRRRVTKFH